MPRYLIHYRDKAALIDMPANAHSDYYGVVQELFASLYGAKSRNYYESTFAEMTSIYPDDITPQGIPFTYDLIRDGMLVGLYCFRDEAPATIKEANAWMRNTHDVVRLYVHRFKLVDFTLPPTPEPKTP